MYSLNLGMWTQLPVKLPVLTTSLILVPWKGWENVLFELGDVDPDTSYTSSSQYLTYTFTFERLGECTLWTWGCGPSYQLNYQFSLPHLYLSLEKVGRMYFLNLGMWTQIPVILPVLSTSLILLPLKGWENVLFELGDVDPDTSYTSSSHYLTYTFTFERLGECTFWTWGCGPRYQLYFQFSVPHLYLSLEKVGRMHFFNLGVKGLSLSKRTQIKEQSRTQATSFPPLHQTRKGHGNEVGTQALFPGVGKTIERYMMNVITLSLSRVINVKFPLQPHQKYYIEYEELRFL